MNKKNDQNHSADILLSSTTLLSLPKFSIDRRVAFEKLYSSFSHDAHLALYRQINHQRIEQQIDRIIDLFSDDPYNEMLFFFYSSSQDNYLPGHMINDLILTIGFAHHLGLAKNDLKKIGFVAFYHDLGMAEFADLFKRGHVLSSEEIASIKMHPTKTGQILQNYFSPELLNAMMDIHEREQGQGYPKGKLGKDIHLWAKIVAICDSFEALTHSRSFRGGFSPYEAIKVLIKKKELFFEESLVKKFIDYLSIYPIGSIVRLNSSDIALVVAANPATPTKPTVQVLINKDHVFDPQGRVIHLNQNELLYIKGVLEREREKEILQLLQLGRPLESVV